MKKFLFTCFLALLCLAGSPPVLSQVVQSPGADFLHRSGPIVSPHSGDAHRGGETLPDTFLKVQQCNAADCKLQTADYQSPEFSLVDTTGSDGQEGGISSARAGEETLRLQPAPVTVFAHPTPVISHPAPPGMLYVEISSPNPPDTLWVTFWEHLLKDRRVVTPGRSIPIVGVWGNMFEGSVYCKVYEISLPKDVQKGYFSLGRGNSTLADQWSFSQADRVRIRFDRVASTVLFGGPMADFYHAQYLVDGSFAEMAFNRDPIMVTNGTEGAFSDSVSKELYQKAQDRPADLFVRATVLADKQDRWNIFERYAVKAIEDLPAWAILQDYADRLTTDQYQSIEGRIFGEVLNQGLTWAELAKETLRIDPAKQEVVKAWEASLQLDQIPEPHPLLIQGESRWINLMADLSDDPFIEVWEGRNSPRKQEILTLYLLENFNLLGDELASLVDIALTQVHTPWLHDRIKALDILHESRLVSDGLAGMDGQPVDLADFKGKTLLLHFWISGCKFCLADYQRVIKGLVDNYASSEDIMLISVNVDRNESTWSKSVATGGYSSPRMLNLKASPDSGMVEYYRIHSFPQKMIIDAHSRIRLQTIRKPDAEQLISLLDSIHASPSPISPSQTPEP